MQPQYHIGDIFSQAYCCSINAPNVNHCNFIIFYFMC